jgi:ribosome maturation factor RimP
MKKDARIARTFQMEGNHLYATLPSTWALDGHEKDHEVVKKIIRRKSKMLIPFLLTYILVLAWSTTVDAQVQGPESEVKKYFQFENPVTKKQVKIETGNSVNVRFKRPNVTKKGVVLTFSDSTVTLAFRQEPYRQMVAFRDIATMKVVLKAKLKYVALVTMHNSKTFQGELIRTTQDSVTLRKSRSRNNTNLAAAEIKTIRIRSKGLIGKRLGICAGTGALLGGIIALSTYKPIVTCSGCAVLDEPFRAGSFLIGVAIGGAAGLLAGSLTLPPDKEFRIEENQAQFALFFNEFKY